MTAAETQLIVGDVAYAGWTDISVTRSMETAAGGFNLGLTSRWPGQETDFPLRQGQACRVAIAGDTVVRGWIDWVVRREDDRIYRLTVAGRDAAGDLVDSAAAHQPGEWRGLTLLDLVRQLARPWGISVRAAFDDPTAFGVFRVQLGETAWSAIERACRFRRALAMSDGKGGLVLVRAATSRADVSLVRGQNIVEVDSDDDNSDRYSDIIVYGQRPAADGEDLASAFHGRGHATDKSVGRWRPLIILAEDQATQMQLQTRAEWEAAVRFGRSHKRTVKVEGWRQRPNGRLWQPNELVHLTWRHIDDEMLISSVEFRSPPEMTILTLYPPEAFRPAPPPAGDAA